MTNQPLPEIRVDSPPASASNTPRRSTALLILTGLWLIIYFAALFTPPLLDDADATHASAARHMALTGDLVTLHVDGIRYLEKAPLPYWLVALSFRIFGFNSFAAHLPQAVAVLLLALLGFHWATRAFNPRTGFYTGLATLTSAGIFLFTRYFIPEVLLSLFLCTALYCFLLALNTNRDLAIPKRLADKEEIVISTLSEVEWAGTFVAAVEKPASRFSPPAHSYVMWTTLALAVLTKGLVALVFFFGTVIVYLLLTGEYKKWRQLKPFTGMLIFLAIAAPWHILAGLRNTGGMNGHGFFWFYFVNEHFLRFLGKRYPKDYNKLPTYLYWTLHLVWLFPWSLFGGTLLMQGYRAWSRYNNANPISEDQISYWQPFAVVVVGLALREVAHLPYFLTVFAALALFFAQSLRRRQKNSPTTEPLIRTGTFSQRTILLLTLFSTLVLIFFSLSTNQEYYTFPAYLPLLLLIAASVTQAESAYTGDKSSHRWITFAHATFTILGAAIALVLTYGLWTSRHEPFVSDIGDLLAHRGVGNYTLSMSALFDLTGPSFAALRLPATLAALAFLIGPAAAWLLRAKQRHLASTTSIALTSATFLIGAHIAFVRFAPMLSSKSFSDTIQQLESTGKISRHNQVLLYGDQAYGSSIPFYLGRDVLLVNGRTTSMLFGSTFPDAPPIFLTSDDLQRAWVQGDRKILFVPIEKRDEVDHLLGNKILLKESSGKVLYTNRPLDK